MASGTPPRDAGDLRSECGTSQRFLLLTFFFFFFSFGKYSSLVVPESRGCGCFALWPSPQRTPEVQASVRQRRGAMGIVQGCRPDESVVRDIVAL